jgi:hypothetical protein
MWCEKKIDGKGRAQKHTPSVLARITMRINWALDIFLPSKFQIEQTMKELWCALGRISVWGWMLRIFILIGVALFLIITFNKAYFNTSWEIDTKLAADFGSFIGGFVGTIFSLIGISVVAYTFDKQFRRTNEMFKEQSRQSEENFKRQFCQTNEMFEEQNKQNRKSEATNNFFKMIDSHNTMLGQMSIEDENGKIIQGRRIFDVILYQYEKIEECITRVVKNKYSDTDYRPYWNGTEYENFYICLAYAILYYGDQESDTYLKLFDWRLYVIINVEIKFVNKKDIVMNHKKVLDECKKKGDVVYNFISRSNRSLLSAYFRSVYCIINFVDKDGNFDDFEKKKLIDIFRSQLSDAELYIWYYHDLSQIKYKEWENGLGDYIKKYQLLADMPFGLDYKY